MNASRFALIAVMVPVLMIGLWQSYEVYRLHHAKQLGDKIEPIQQQVLSLSLALEELRGRTFMASNGASPAAVPELERTVSQQIAELGPLLVEANLGYLWREWQANFYTRQDDPVTKFFKQSAAIEALALISDALYHQWTLRVRPSETVAIAYQFADGEALRLANNVGQIRALEGVGNIAEAASSIKRRTLVDVQKIQVLVDALVARGVQIAPQLRSDLWLLRDELRNSLARADKAGPSQVAAGQQASEQVFADWTPLVDKAKNIRRLARSMADQQRHAEFQAALRRLGLIWICCLLTIAIAWLAHRRQARTEVARSIAAERLALAVSATRMGIWVRNLRTEEIYWSDELRRLLGLPPGVEPQPLLQVVHPQDMQRIQTGLQQLIAAPVEDAKPVLGDSRVMCFNGESRWMRFVFNKTRVAQDADGIVGVVIDIDEQYQTQLELEGTREMLQRRNEELQNFTRSTAHDLLEPIRMMRSFAELLEVEMREAGGLTETAERFLGFLLEGSGRAQETLKSLQRYLSMAHPPEPERIDLNAVVAAVQDDLMLLIEESGAVLEVEDLPEVMGSAQALHSLFQNLIANAIKYVSEGVAPKLTIRLQPHDEHVVVSLQDNGIGIEAQYIDSIFEPFRRLHTRKDYAGTGLGLSICQRVVENMGGRIWAESEPGTGTRFYMDLGDKLTNETDAAATAVA